VISCVTSSARSLRSRLPLVERPCRHLGPCR
jgi:hypothetical protein